MGHKTLIRLLITLAAIAVVALIVKLVNSGGVEVVSAGSDRNKVFEDFPINDVAQVRVKSADGEVNLKKGENAWEVVERDGFRAKGEDIVKFIRSVWDLKVVQSPEVGASQFARMELLDPDQNKEDSATVVSFLDGSGKELKSLWLGKVYARKENRPNPFGSGPSTTDAGRYVKTGDGDEVLLVNETFDNVKTDPAEWLDDTFFKVEKLESIAIETGDKAEDWKLTRTEENGDFTLDGNVPEGKELDSTKVSSMKNAFSSPRFEDVIVGEEAGKNSPDKTTFKIETFDGFSYTVKLSDKTEDNEYYLTFAVEGKFPEKRKQGEEESDEEKKKADEEFAGNLKELKDKLATEKRLAGKVYKVRSYVADSIDKKRSEILKDKEKAEKEGAKSGEVAPGVTDLPGVTGGMPAMPEKAAEPKKESPKPEAKPENPAPKPAAPEKKPEPAAKPAEKPKAESMKEAAPAPEKKSEPATAKPEAKPAAAPVEKPAETKAPAPAKPEAKAPEKPKATPAPVKKTEPVAAKPEAKPAAAPVEKPAEAKAPAPTPAKPEVKAPEKPAEVKAPEKPKAAPEPEKKPAPAEPAKP